MVKPWAASRTPLRAVDWVRDGQIAIEALASHRYDIVFSTSRLPGRTTRGVAALDPRGRDDAVPVLIVTARETRSNTGLQASMPARRLCPEALRMAGSCFKRMRAVARRKGWHCRSAAGQQQVLSLDMATKVVTSNEAILCALRSARQFAAGSLVDPPRAILSRPASSRSDLPAGVWKWENATWSEFRVHSLRKETRQRCDQEREGVGWLVPKRTRRQSRRSGSPAWLSILILRWPSWRGFSFMLPLAMLTSCRTTLLRQIAAMVERDHLPLGGSWAAGR